MRANAVVRNRGSNRAGGDPGEVRPGIATLAGRLATLLVAAVVAACHAVPGATGRSPDAMRMPAAEAGTAGRGAAPAPSGTAMFRADPGHTGVYDAAPFREVGGVAWTARAAAPVRSSAAIAGGAVYVGATDGVLQALELAGGRELWRYDAGSAITSSPAVAGGRVVFGTVDGTVQALAAPDGTPAWSVATAPFRPLRWGWDYYTPSPLVVGDTVVVVGGDGVLRARALADGAPLMEAALDTVARSTPAYADGVVYVGDVAGVVYAVDLATGAVRWRHETEGAGLASSEYGFDRQTVQASPAVADGTVYIGSRDGRLYALDAATGVRRWTVSYAPSWVASSAVVKAGVVYTGTSDAHLVQALDAATGDVLWSLDVGSRVLGSPALVGEALVVADEAGLLRGLDPGTGAELWRYHGAGPFHASPAAGGELLVVGDDAGVIHALRGCGPTPRLAVYWDSATAGLATTPGGAGLRDALAARGYRVLDAAGLRTFLEERGTDDVPSVVVFALDHVPAAVDATASDSLGPLRRYLDGGGKVVWLGLPPRAVVRDSTGRAVGFDPARAAPIAGVAFEGVEGGEYGGLLTETGAAWGVDRFRMGRLAVDPDAVDHVLTADAFGRASAWVRSFGGGPGTGFVYLWGLGAGPELHDDVARVAEYGVLRSPPGTVPARCVDSGR